MNQKQRSKRNEQNRINAQKSTGPKTPEGKAHSRANALTHGLTATVLLLPDENPDDIYQKLAEWARAVEPSNPKEYKLAEKLAVEGLRIERLLKAESVGIAEQVANAETDFDHAEQWKLIELSERFWIDPKRALLELQTFSAGAEWLLDRWTWIRDEVVKNGTFTGLDQIKESLRLLGYDPNHLQRESPRAHDWALLAFSCLPADRQTKDVVYYLDKQSPSPSQTDAVEISPCPSAPARERILAKIDEEMKELRTLGGDLEHRENESLERRKRMAPAPEDTPKNRLWLRYMTAAESSFARTFKAIEKLKSEHKNEGEKAMRAASGPGPKVASRNEAKSVEKELQSPILHRTYSETRGSEKDELEEAFDDLMKHMDEQIKASKKR